MVVTEGSISLVFLRSNQPLDNAEVDLKVLDDPSEFVAISRL